MNKVAVVFPIQPYPHRGAGLLLSRCAALSGERPSAYQRLEHAIGDELARLLVFALSGSQGRRGSSSP